MNKRPFNYLFFGIFFAVVCALSFVQLSSLLSAQFSSKCLFALTIVGQSFLEVVMLAFVAHLLARRAPKFLFKLFISLVTLLAFFHFIDLILVRFLDMSVWFGINFVMEDSLWNFMEHLYASNISLVIWGAFGLGFMALSFIGLTLYKYTERLSEKFPLPFSTPMQLLSITTLGSALFIWDFSFHSLFSKPDVQRLKQALPFKTTFYPQTVSKVYLSSPLPKNSFDQDLKQLPSPKITPDIYLFVVESLRDDFITEDVAPNLSHFKSKNLSFDLALSSSNGTHLSWFSIFHSQLPFYWSSIQKSSDKMGALPLRMLKQWGYDIHVITASHIEYYQMNQVLFGANNALADTYTFFSHSHHRTPSESDSLAMEALNHSLAGKEASSPRLFVVFLDSTHFDYSWPKETFSRFHPAAKRINYLKASWSDSDIEKVRNRYRNALHYVDHLFGTFLTALDQSPRKDNSIVIFTADHGEEFYEKGFLFHGSHLSHEQTNVPLYFHFGNNVPLPSKRRPAIASHIDIFPTLIHTLTRNDPRWLPCQGESLFKQERWPYVVTTRYNGGRAPFEFYIHNGQKKLLLQFDNRSSPSTCRELNIISLTDAQDRQEKVSTAAIKRHFGLAFPRIFPY